MRTPLLQAIWCQVYPQEGNNMEQHGTTIHEAIHWLMNSPEAEGPPELKVERFLM
jgi:hypothetical protein